MRNSSMLGLSLSVIVILSVLSLNPSSNVMQSQRICEKEKLKHCQQFITDV